MTFEYSIEPGRSHPLGAVPEADGVNFSVFSQHATAVELLLFEKDEDRLPQQTIQLDPKIHKTFHFWHVYLKGLKPGAGYAYRVDGFRFDEGSILSRGENGVPMLYPSALWSIELSEALADTKIIAEAWDAAGLYQVGNFPGYRWAEWNGRYRDDIRRFVRGDPGLIGAVAARIAGSADLYQSSGHLPIDSINFITCHDGFTLNDLVSYNSKHNEANGEGNRDGNNENFSWNSGIEGETTNREIEELRQRQIENFITILLLSQGVPMLLAGDEIRRTQQGNNNAYCQDNEIGWFDWHLLEKNHHLFRFFQQTIAFRQRTLLQCRTE